MLLPTLHALSAASRRQALCMAAISLAGCIPWPRAESQQVHGSLAVSLTIVEPVGSTWVRAAPLATAADGRLSLATSSPVTGPTSHILMVEVTDGDTNGVRPLRVALRNGGLERPLHRDTATPVGRDGTVPVGATAGHFPVSYLVQNPTAARAQQPIRLRVRYLAVAGT